MTDRMDYSAKTSRIYFGSVLMLEGLVTLLAPDRLVLVAAYQAFFEGMPHTIWASLQMASAVAIMLPSWGRGVQYRRVLTYPAIVCAAMWSLAAVYPFFIGRTGNVVTAIIWLAWAMATWWLCYPGSREKVMEMLENILRLMKVRDP